MPSDVFYISILPSEVRLIDVVIISLVALFISISSTIYPSVKAASISPVESLRYE